MNSVRITGGKRLKGEVIPQGAKNEALQILSAVLLTDEKITINNVPDIIDVNILVDFILGNQIPTPSQFAAADLNQDTIIDVMDIVLLVDLILGSTLLPVQSR